LLGDIHDLDLMLESLQLLSLGAGPNQLHHLHQFKKRIESDRIRRMTDTELIFGKNLPLFRKWSKQMKKRNTTAALKNAQPEILSYCQRFDPDPPHALHVEKLALQIFDKLSDLSMHSLDKRYRTLLSYGCLLHDIGWIKGQRRHHKRAYKMIDSSDLPLNKKDKSIAALIARFHRKAIPAKQSVLSKLSSKELTAISQLSAIIRIADVLDRYHDQKTSIEKISLTEDALIIIVSAGSLANIPKAALTKKSSYFPQVFGIPAVIVEKQKKKATTRKPAATKAKTTARKPVTKPKATAKKAALAKKTVARNPAATKAKTAARKPAAKPKATAKKAAPAKKTSARKPAATKSKTTARKPVTKPKATAKKASSAKKTAARKPAATKAKTTARKPAAKPKATAKKAAPAKKAAARKPVKAKAKTTARKPVAKPKATAKKTAPAKKTAVRKTTGKTTKK
jgi:Ppx/GppA phosphatase family protein